MRSKTFDASNIKELLARQKIATMPELQTTLGTHVNIPQMELHFNGMKM
jgi:hypothetical protein